MSTDIAPPADGTEVRLNGGMPGTYEGQPAIVRHCHPRSGHSNLPGLVWLECEVIWSHGTADGFWAGRGEYRTGPESHQHVCASTGYPNHEASAYCICICGKRFDGRRTAPEGDAR